MSAQTLDSLQLEHDRPIAAEDLLEQYRFAIDKSTILSKTDSKGFITYANDEFCRISKYRLDELIGQRHNIVRHPNMSKEAFRELWDTIRGHRAWHGVIENRARDDSSYWVKTTVIPIIGSGGEIREHIAIRSDITEQINAQQQLERVLEATSRFVPERFLQLLERGDIAEARLGDSRMVDVTVLFADIRGFTTMSEQRNPDEILHDLNAFYAHINPAIHDHGGVIDKYVGDAIMALFPEPSQALVGARAMLRQLEDLNDLRRSADLLPFKIGIGLHTGRVILGTVGTENRVSTTVLGDAVNVAARLEQSTKRVDYDILASEATIALIQDRTDMERLGRVQLRGRREPITVYGIRSETRNT